MQGRQGRNSRQEAGGRNWSRDQGGVMLLACSSCLAQFISLYCPEPPARSELTPMDLVISTINQENCLAGLPAS